MFRMALTGLQIQKLLPKTNCKECGSNTCLAFAMKLAAKRAELALCPYASDEAKKVLGAAAEPPIKTIALGPEKSVKLGDESVLYRHEKTFVNKTVFAINVDDTYDPTALDALLADINAYLLVRVGETLRVDMGAVTQKSTDPVHFAEVARKVWTVLQRPLVLRSTDPGALAAAARAVQGSRSVLGFASESTADTLVDVARECNHTLAVTAQDLNGLVALTSRLKDSGFDNLVLQFPSLSPAEQFQVNTTVRRVAIKDNFKPLGYPSILFVPSGDLLENTVTAVTEVCKYGGICVLPTFAPAQLATLLTLRLNIFTDPQKPIQVEPKLYAIGEPKPDSPVFVTTNFSLTYFIVSGEIENCGLNAWLLVPECEGMSVLTAWAAGKFSGAVIGKFAREIGLNDLVTSRQIIIPGYVSQISGELEESMPGWKVRVGPQEVADLEGFVRTGLN
jgi:acetyl-CoA decarbonylase/synthase, CODH/ACS complex subunit gamma